LSASDLLAGQNAGGHTMKQRTNTQVAARTATTSDTVNVDYGSGDWRITPGNEQAFVSCWREFIEWTKAEAPGFVHARLIHETANPQHFISFAEWESVEDMHRWRQMSGFGERMSACRQLCAGMSASDYQLDAHI